ncbi:hypothetical protein CS053_04715 [Rhodanobacter glycinis]|uniref:Uncharacterized protein n=1 Tax=Rhodanobacter glycinis TaxID=582702 RepID=A0A5B9DYR9_9GAMM|nr:hypothetical protein [Rhodanobacter glycinis]QEE23885.1 hypothetical protein CS053_04715 [Rhodanobacter glycinis]
MPGHFHEWFDDFRMLAGSWSWKSVMTWAVVMAAATAIMVYTARRPASPPSSPQPAIVVSYRFTPMNGGMSGGCSTGGVTATVRLNDGQTVSAATYQYGYGIVRDGALVTVRKFRALCGPAPYTILHGGPPDSPVQQAHYAPR